MDVGTATGLDPGCLREAGYELVSRLGEGGMGEVWAAARLGVEGAIKPCAIKVIRPAFANDEQYRRLFVAEGRVAMMLGHANIVSVFDVGVVDDLLFMAMDWVDGVDLQTFRQQVQLAAGGRPMAVEDAVHIAGALLDALGYAHDYSIAGREHGIVHRDVSPGNVMITSRGEVKLMDFGLAGLDQELRGGLRGELRGALHEGPGPRFRGTLRYLSREQARGRPEPASDLYAVGAILHELLDGRKFRHWCTSDEELVNEIFNGGIPPLERKVPAPIEALRRGLLEPRAELRIKTARRALAQLSAWLGYRNRRVYLEALYRQVFGEPRSGLTQLLSLDVRSELLDELRRRVEAGPIVAGTKAGDGRGGGRGGGRGDGWATWVAPDCPSTGRDDQRTVPMRAARVKTGAAGPEAASADAVVRARSAERASVHRVAQQTGGNEAAACDHDPASAPDLEDPSDQEITEPWPSKTTRESSRFDESATAWLVPSSTDPGLGALAVDVSLGPRVRLALMMVLAALVGGVSTLIGMGVVMGVAWGSGEAAPTAVVHQGRRP